MPTCSNMPIEQSCQSCLRGGHSRAVRVLRSSSFSRATFRSVGELLFRQRHAMGAYPIVLSGMADQSAPAAADVEQGFSRQEPPICGRSYRACRPAPSQVVVPVFEIGAGVDHLRIEEFGQKTGGEVVVIMDVLLVARLGPSTRGFSRRLPAATGRRGTRIQTWRALQAREVC